MAAALAGLFFYSSCSPTEKAETKDFTRRLALLFRVYLSGFSDLGIHADASEWNRMYGLG